MFFAIFVVVLIGGCACDNATDRLLGGDFRTKTGRLISFNTQDDDIVMELDFSVPFLTIPVKKTMDNAKSAMANINVGAIVLAGAVALVAAVIVPGVLMLFNKEGGAGGLFNKPGLGGLFGGKFGPDHGRGEDEGRSTLWKFMDTLDKALSENDIDTTSCMQRAICWTTQSSNRNMAKGRASSGDKIIDGIATNEWVKNIIDGTVFEAAIESGLRGDNCSKIYNQCSINQNTLHHFAMQYMSPRSSP